MKTSIQTSAIIDVLGVDPGFAAIKNAGFEAVDLAMDGFYSEQDAKEGKPCAFFDDEEKFAAYTAEVIAAAKKYGLTFGQFHAPFPTWYPRNPKGTEVIRETIAKTIKMCHDCDCKYLIIHPVADGSARYPSLTKKQEIAENMDYFTSIIPLLKQYNVVCCLENMWKLDWGTKKAYVSSCSDMNEACMYIDKLNEIAGGTYFGFCLDIGHLLLLGIDPWEAMEVLGDRLVTLHVHDNCGNDDDHTMPYLGVCNWERFIKGVKAVGYQGTLNFETSGFNWHFPKELLPDAIKMLGATADYLRNRIDAPAT